MLLSGKDFQPNRRWIAVIVLLTLSAIAWYAVVAIRQNALPGGSSKPGFVFGVVAGLIIVFEFLIWPRKGLILPWPRRALKARAWRIISAQTLLRAHIWLGLLSLPLAILHARLFFFGGWLNFALMGIFLVVIASGIYGLALQQFLPRLLMERVPQESIYAQLDHVAEQLCRDAEELVLAICGRGSEAGDAAGMSTSGSLPSWAAVTGSPSPSGMPTSAVASRGMVEVVPGAGLIRERFLAVVKPYLLSGRQSGSSLRYPFEAQQFFRTLRNQSPVPAQEVVDMLEELCDRRRQFDLQIRLHHWLHAWLYVHLPLSVALLVLLGMHVFVALRYW